MGSTMLIVDDDPAFRRIARALLTARGFSNIVEAADASSARAAAQEHHPEAVLLDYHLPGCDGITLAAQLWAQDALPVILLTSSDLLNVSDTHLAAHGIRAFLPKDQLVEADLRRLFGGDGQWSSAPPS